VTDVADESNCPAEFHRSSVHARSTIEMPPVGIWCSGLAVAVYGRAQQRFQLVDQSRRAAQSAADMFLIGHWSTQS
jgi:hypothetical protein